jgi:hypothetical protein
VRTEADRPTSDARRSPGVVPEVELGKLRKAKPRDYVIRFALGAVISIGAAIASKAVGARFGGIFLAFPAILPASLTLIQEKEGTRRADRDAVGAVLGGAALIAFAMIAELSLRRIEPYLAVILALLGWIVASVGLYALLAWLRPDDCDKTKD